jgi:hypothetical protein
MTLHWLVSSAAAAAAVASCPAPLPDRVNDVYTHHLRGVNASPPVKIQETLRWAKQELSPSLYRDLLAATSLRPGRPYLDFDPFFLNQVRTYSFRLAGCSMVTQHLGVVQVEATSGLSRDRSSRQCLLVEVVSSQGRWRIQDILSTDDEDLAAPGQNQACALLSRDSDRSLSRLTKSLKLILSE